MQRFPFTIIDVFPDKAQYRPGDKGNIVIEFEGTFEKELRLYASFKKLHHEAWQQEIVITTEDSSSDRLYIPFDVPQAEWECYGVDLEVRYADQFVGYFSTAFDVADHWRRAPRYGFLSDFKKEDLGDLADVESLNKFHLNIIQFYDWMYRHDDLIPPTDDFIDPMGRELSYKVVQEKINAVHEKGMAAMAYGAVYASLKDFHQNHRELGLYKRNGEPFHLIDIFYIMDISPDSAWNDIIIGEFRNAIEEGFDGIHMDQYGFPKKAIRYVQGKEEVVDLATCYPVLIDKTKASLREVNSEVGLIFNNVSNYPVHATAKSDQDAVYIEVWPPVIHLRELKQLIDRGRELSEDKHVILSAYLPPFKLTEHDDPASAENGAILTMATIFASGGYHLLLGEENNVLTEAYYPSYGKMRESFIEEVRRYYDFIVRYGKLLYDHRLLDVSMTHTGGINTEVTFKGEVPFSPNGDVDTVWTMVKQLPDYQMIHLINLVGLEDDYWEHGKKSRPVEQKDIECTVLMEKKIKAVYSASPDSSEITPSEIKYETVEHDQGIAIRFKLESLKIWNMIYIEWEN